MGLSIGVFHEQWLPKPSFFKSITPAFHDELRVSDLIDSTSIWNYVFIKHLFLMVDWNNILAIPLSIRHTPDSLVWHFDKSGEYSVKLGYCVARNNHFTSSSRGGGNYFGLNRHNNKLFNGNVIDTLKLIDQAQSYLIEFQTNSLRTEMEYSTHSAPSAIHWYRLDAGSLKLNIDAAIL
ncbi:hypothetical protein PanWU01x14_350910 [Parasponia andersonii]|uniref:Uncharacterized protein n=1 Tax=Parasponia andersonii TaxID=3476 RepID=A0A2P5AAT9_PARAD|nr:hypothetical protein PanWU01x14_350910 [Parasponia andersonii]